MAFPAIKNPVNIDITTEFSTLSYQFAGGYEQTRELNSRKRKMITAKYVLDRTDKDALISHYNDVAGSTAFSWTNPDDNTVYTVRYAEAPKVPISGAWPDRFDVTIKMREV